MTTSTGYAVATISDLKAIDSSIRVDGYIRSVTSERSWFIFIAAASDTADNVNIIAPNSGTGRWFKIKSFVLPSDISGLEEFIEDTIGIGFLNSSQLSFTYNDSSNTLTIDIGNNSITNAHINSSAAIAQSKISGLDSSLASKANVSHVHAAAEITDFNEALEDRVASALVAGSNVNISYNDAAGTITISAISDGSLIAKDEGTTLGTFNTINFTGSSVSSALAGNQLNVNVTSPSTLNSDTYVVTTTTSIAANAQETVTLSGLTLGTCINLTTNFPARVRAYINSAYAAADAARAVNIDPTGEHGCLLECVTTPSNLDLDLSPPIDLYSKSGGNISVILTNYDSVSRTVSCTFTILKW